VNFQEKSHVIIQIYGLARFVQLKKRTNSKQSPKKVRISKQDKRIKSCLKYPKRFPRKGCKSMASKWQTKSKFLSKPENDWNLSTHSWGCHQYKIWADQNPIENDALKSIFPKLLAGMS